MCDFNQSAPPHRLPCCKYCNLVLRPSTRYKTWFAAQPEKTMESCSCSAREGSLGTKPLEALLDKLVALRMDLGSMREKKAARTHVVVSLDLVAGLNEILLLAVGDVRNIIRDIDGSGLSRSYTGYQRAGEPSQASLQG
jgi:hypothetical protein